MLIECPATGAGEFVCFGTAKFISYFLGAWLDVPFVLDVYHAGSADDVANWAQPTCRVAVELCCVSVLLLDHLSAICLIIM
jgi:hypothetical protein